MSEKPYTNTPINTTDMSLVGEGGLLFEHKDKIIRFNEEFAFSKDGQKLTGQEKRLRVEEGLIESRDLFEELESVYGVRTAGFYPVIVERNDGTAGAMIVSDRIEGSGFTVDEPLPGEVKAPAEELFYKLSGYLKEKRNKDESFLRDIFDIEQYLYDESAGEFVLVDVDPYLSDSASDDTEYAWSLRSLAKWAENAIGEEAASNWYNDTVNSDGSAQLADMMTRIMQHSDLH